MKKIGTLQIEDAVKRLAEAYQPLRIYLFGSYAWGEPHAESDLDFMLVLPDNITPTFELRRKGNRALAGVGCSVDFIFNTSTSFDYQAEHPSSLEYKIKKEGKIVYDTARTMAL